MKVELRAFDSERDLAVVKKWLEHPQVARWWGSLESALAEIGNHPADASALIMAGGNPVGYLCWQTPTRAELEEAGLADLPEELVDIDIMIGEPAMTGLGIGPEALRKLFASLHAEGVPMVGVATALSNQRALSAFEKVGLLPYRDFIEMGESYRYITKQLNDAAS